MPYTHDYKHVNCSLGTACHIRFLARDTPPFKKQAAQECNSCTGNGKNIRIRDGEIVGRQESKKLGRRNDLSYVCSTSLDNDLGSHSRCVPGNLLDQGVAEDVLCNRDRNGATQTVEEYSRCIAGRHILLVQNHLNRNKGNLHTHSGTKTSKNLVTNPCASARLDFEGTDQSRANCEYGTADPGEGYIDAENGNQASHSYRSNGHADQIRDYSDAGFLSACPFDGLKVERQVIDICVQHHSNEGTE